MNFSHVEPQMILEAKKQSFKHRNFYITAWLSVDNLLIT